MAKDKIIEKIIKIKEITKKRRHCLFIQAIRDVFCSKTYEHRVVKTAFHFPIGVLFALGLHYGIIQYLELEEFVMQVLSLTLGFCLTLGYALSVQIRCMCWLVLPTIFGKSGRAYLVSLAITHVIDGPFDNVLYNTNESVRVMGCITSLAFNHSIERSRLMFRPIKQMANEFNNGGNVLQKEVQRVVDSYFPIQNEVEGKEEVTENIREIENLDKQINENRVQTIEERFRKRNQSGIGMKKELNYRKKLEYRCEYLFTKAVENCRNTLRDTHAKCLSRVFLVGWLVCAPLLMHNACDLIEAKKGEDGCRSEKNINKNFGGGYESLAMVDQEMHENFIFNLQYKMNLPKEKVHQATPEDITEALAERFTTKKKLANLVIIVIKRFLAFVFLFVFLRAKSYNDKYLKDIKHDNIYITKYFRRIDQRRKRLGKSSLLPLIKTEKKSFVVSSSLGFSKHERKRFMTGTVLLFFQMIFVAVLVGFDRVFYELLMVLRRSSQVQYRQKGIHHIQLDIEGEGFVAKIVRSIVNSFKVKHSLDKITTTMDCLPYPRAVNSQRITTIWIIYGIVWILICTQAYGLRLRSYVCSIFYPKRQKKRIIYVYNEQLKKRKNYLRWMRHRLRKMIRDEGFMLDRSVTQILVQDYPKTFGWLKYLKIGLMSCIICQERETPQHYICPDPCGLCYCNNCWKDFGERCYSCSPTDDSLSELSSDEAQADD
ncbi:E3 ubiquitin-protein ligase DCST1-like isoform X1 [Centruroides sculpturatus]|uniref:E3 ubiquitin-protein ligase DCST1-like isoform X1 n=1 Tax=Centruroides sculpturatus TaxID=218467 RepID=UPI000C6C923A|nr:E3 ubiquitin-protein ligase DCST1-like isoform X1 [Centruroides sculpturatus]